MELQRADAVCSLFLLQGRGLPVKTVIDVGAAEGSFFLIRGEAGLFPEAHHFFVDAMEENAPLYHRVARCYPASHSICAVANFDGEAELDVDPGAYNTHVAGLQPPHRDYARRRVPVRTLDRLCRERPHLSGPYLLKLDVQGGELDALRGATQVLAEASIVLVESQICLFRDTLVDIAEYLRARGLVLYDLTNLAYFHTDSTLYQCQAVFIPQRLDFRRTEAWASPEKERQERIRMAERQSQVRGHLERLCASVESRMWAPTSGELTAV
jgi:FkbM family methyltransferase